MFPTPILAHCEAQDAGRGGLKAGAPCLQVDMVWETAVSSSSDLLCAKCCPHTSLTSPGINSIPVTGDNTEAVHALSGLEKIPHPSKQSRSEETSRKQAAILWASTKRTGSHVLPTASGTPLAKAQSPVVHTCSRLKDKARTELPLAISSPVACHLTFAE